MRVRTEDLLPQLLWRLMHRTAKFPMDHGVTLYLYPDQWSPTALQPWSLLCLRRNPPKRVLLRQGFGGYPLRIPPELYSCGFLRRRVNGTDTLELFSWQSEWILFM